jgi:hypothetical protein
VAHIGARRVTKRRHRSREVALVTLPVLAAAFTACGGSDTAYCVDRNDNVVENRYCDDFVFHPGFFWYYGGHASGGKFVRGTHLTGGDRVANSDIVENTRRGGFGSSAKTRASGIGRAVAAHSGGG